MKKSLLCMITTCVTLPMMAHADSPYFSFKDGDGFKRFSVSEPYRVCRRVNILRDYSDEKTKLYPRN